VSWLPKAVNALLHGRGDVAVDAAHAGQAVAEPAGLGDLGDGVFDEPGLTVVPPLLFERLAEADAGRMPTVDRRLLGPRPDRLGNG
jgi:hypothetical protein